MPESPPPSDTAMRLPLSHSRLSAVYLRVADDASAPAARLCFACTDVEGTRRRAADHSGRNGEGDSPADDQGVPLRFAPADAIPAGARTASSGALGVVIVQVPDTAKARSFYEHVFGQTFYRVGSGDFWWVESGPSMGVFPITHDLANPPVPRKRTGIELAPFFCVDDLERAMARVKECGGQASAPVRFGPYPTCCCKDGEGLSFGLWSTPG